jgi:hypothetical protein
LSRILSVSETSPKAETARVVGKGFAPALAGASLALIVSGSGALALTDLKIIKTRGASQ